MDIEVARNFLIALLIGALVGIEREKRKDTPSGHSFGGIRTFILLALVGAASAWIAQELAMPWTFVVALAVVGAAVLASYVRQNRRSADALGLTTEIAALVVCLLGGMAVAVDSALAVALGVVTSAVLAYKQPLHGLVERIGADDIYAGIKLLIASFIVLPLLPDEPVDPWRALNPYKLWLLVVLISALSLVGYVAMRWLGAARGAAVSGLSGGLVSSTAATLSLARASRERPDAVQDHAVSAGILLAWLVMFVRIAILVAVVNRQLLLAAWMPLAAMGVATAGFAAWHYRTGATRAAPREKAAMALANPFSLSAAVRFGLLFAAVLLVVRIVQQRAPGAGVYAVAALAGAVDTDAIALSLADGARDAKEHASAGVALAIAALSNTAVKCAIVLALGRNIRSHIAIASAVIGAVGLATIGLGSMGLGGS